MTLRRISAALLLASAALATPSSAAPACPWIVDPAGDATYGSLGKGSSDLDLREIHIASGPRTVLLVAKLATMAGTATELRLGARVDVRISLEPIDYFFAARRAMDGTWRFSVTGVRIGADGRPTEIPERSVEGRVDPAAAEVVFIANRADFVERIDGRIIRLLGGKTFLGADVSVQEVDRADGAVGYRDRSRACRVAS